jgi:hypothetical protein
MADHDSLDVTWESTDLDARREPKTIENTGSLEPIQFSLSASASLTLPPLASCASPSIDRLLTTNVTTHRVQLTASLLFSGLFAFLGRCCCRLHGARVRSGVWDRNRVRPSFDS